MNFTLPVLQQPVIDGIFAHRNAIIDDDHFVYAKKVEGWFHGTGYVNKDAIYPYVDDVSVLCREMVRRAVVILGGVDKIDFVVGPTVGAVSLAQWTTHWLHQIEGNDRIVAVCADEGDVLATREVALHDRLEFNAAGKVTVFVRPSDATGIIRAMYTEKIGTERVIKRGYDAYVRGKRGLGVEDILNTGLTVAKTRDAVLEAGGEVVAVACLCNRSGGKVTAGTLCVPELFSLLDLDMKMFPEADCPICKEKGPESVRTDLGKGKDFLVRVGIKPGDK